MSHDDTEGQLINFPVGGDVLNRPPELPDPGRLFPPVREDTAIPPESPEETTMELPVIPRPMDPEMALRSEGFSAPEIDGEFDEGGESEYVHRRSLAERLGDWLEYRIALGHARIDGEAPFREAEIARKVELLKAKTAREVGLLEQQNKLREAELKARSDKTAARGKGDAAGAKAGGKGASGLGADKGGRKTGPQGPAPKQQPRPQQQMKQQAPASKPRSPKQPAPAPKQQPKLQGPAPKQSKGDDKPRQKDGAGDRKVDLSKGDRLKKTPDGTKGAGGGKSPAPGPKGGTDSKSGRDRRKIRYDEPKKLPSGVRHGSADAYDEHQCRCRRCVNAAHLAGKRAETKGADTTGPGGRKTSENSPEPPSESPKEGGGPTGPEGAAKGAEQPSDGSSAPGGGTSKSRPGPGFDGGSAEGPGWTGNRKETPKWPGHDRPPRRADQGEDDIVDADIVPGEPMAVTTGGKGLPPAPEERIERPGTTRPTAQEDPVASQVSKPASGQAGMAAKHRTDITFGEYLTEIVNIAIAAGVDEDRAQELAAALGKVADALRDMAADLVGDHNIATEVVNQITDLADAASRMKQLAERCATECEIASQAARLAATAVGRTYREDIQAMDDAGLANASSAAHHN